MKHILLVSMLMSFPVFAQNSLTPSEKEMIEYARKASELPPTNMASPKLRDRMQSEMGDDFSAFDVGKCRYELVGVNIPTETMTEKGEMDFEDCQKKAKRALKESPQHFTKVLIRHKAREEWVIVEKK